LSDSQRVSGIAGRFTALLVAAEAGKFIINQKKGRDFFPAFFVTKIFIANGSENR
jgi:hypothetical protein